MAGPCDICGGYTNRGIAVKNQIVTCCKCRINCEHIYCMRGKFLSNWTQWVCESCAKEERKGDPAPSSVPITDGRQFANTSRSLHSGWQAHSNKQKAVETGKVRFITHKEVQQLAKTSPQKTSVLVKSVSPKFPLSRVTAPSDTQPKCGRLSNWQNVSISEKGSPFSTPRTVMPCRRGRPPKMLSISRINEQAYRVTKHQQENWSSGTPAKGQVIKEKLMDASRRAETSGKKIVMEPKKLSCTPSPSRHSSLYMSRGGETSTAHSDGEERDLLDTFSNLHLYRMYLPALHATWKGGFSIFNADTPAQFFGGFQAQLPCNGHRRVGDFSQKMPAVLHATWLPRRHLLDDPFQNDYPGLEDVAIYFFPDDSKASSRQIYASLFKILDTTSSVMTVQFDGGAMELLVYTSKQLRLDFLDTVTCPKAQNFIWGIFRSKSDSQAHMGDTGTADMEVDMAGSVDVIVPKDSSTPCKTSELPIMTAVQQLLRITKEEHSTPEDKRRALDTAIKQMLGVELEELKGSDAPASSATGYSTALQPVKLKKDNDEVVWTSSTARRRDNQS